jgi:hypothetical protein
MQTVESLPKIAAAESRDRIEDPRWQLAQRIAASGSLGRSRLMADFLLYVVDRHILDRSDEITEQQIGVLVFGRPEGYDSNEDNIVRSYARNLRKRMEEYFSGEGRNEVLRIEIPRGGYIPLFSVQAAGKAEAPDRSIGDTDANDEPRSNGNFVASDPAEPPESTFVQRHEPVARSMEGDNDFALTNWLKITRAALRKKIVLPALCVGIALGLGAAFFLPRKLLKLTIASPAETASNILWAQLFSNERDTFIVPSDDGLVIMQGLTERPVPLASYVNGSYRTNLKTDAIPGAPEILKLGGRRYTSVVDLDFVAHLAQLDEVVPARMMIRYARDLRIQDLRAGNAILIGSIEANPWIELFQPQMNFRFSINAGSDKPSGIVNSRPRVGENVIYGTPRDDHTYGLIAYVPNLTSTGHVLIVGGLNTAGTEAATTFLLTPALMMPTLQRARAVHGSLRPFELLVGAGNVATNASTPQVILERIGPP